MVVGDLDVVRAVVGPDEADPVLVVDADGVRAGTVAEQLLQAVAGWHPQAVRFGGRVEEAELLLRGLLQFGSRARTSSRFQTFSVSLSLKDRITAPS